jgi:hypothetical protein
VISVRSIREYHTRFTHIVGLIIYRSNIDPKNLSKSLTLTKEEVAVADIAPRNFEMSTFTKDMDSNRWPIALTLFQE